MKVNNLSVLDDQSLSNVNGGSDIFRDIGYGIGKKFLEIQVEGAQKQIERARETQYYGSSYHFWKDGGYVR